MNSKATTVDQYLSELPEERKAGVTRLRNIIKNNLPKGFAEGMGYGMPGFSVPHSLYPPGYHCTPALPLPFISFASQKNFTAIYHMGIYAMPDLLKWFLEEYPKHSVKKLDMGKSCLRFKKIDDIPYELIGELSKKVSVEKWIEVYEEAFRSGSK